jgi:hypothetical protein
LSCIWSPGRRLLADAAPPGHIQRQHIDMAPLQPSYPGRLAGVRRRSAQCRQKKSLACRRCARTAAARLSVHYFAGREPERAGGYAWQKALRALLWSLLLVALFGLLAGGLVWWWVTRPVKS